MSIKRMVAVWDHSQHNGAALLLLLAIADYADENGVAWPGMGTLAKKVRMHRRHIPRLLDELCTSGELEALSRPRQRSNVYIVKVGLAPDELGAAKARATELGATGPRGDTKKSLPTKGGDTKGVSEVTPPGCQATPPGCQGDTTRVPDPSLSVIDPSVKRQWGSILADASLQMVKTTFDQTLLGSEVVAVEDGTWTIALRLPLAVEWVDKRLRPLVERAAWRYAPDVALQFVEKEGAA